MKINENEALDGTFKKVKIPKVNYDFLTRLDNCLFYQYIVALTMILQTSRLAV